MADENAPVSEETQETPVETTTSESAPETETTLETEKAPVAVSEQPAEKVEEEKPPRSEKRIHELSQRLKQSEAKNAYWEKLNALPPVAPEQPETEFLTADQIADSVIRKQQTQQVEQQKVEANNEMQRDIIETLEKHPDLENNDKLSKTVFSYAQANNMRISDAADEIKAQIKANDEKIKKEVIASQSGRVGVTTPQGGRVSTGDEKINVDSMSEDEKAANWGKILQSYQK